MLDFLLPDGVGETLWFCQFSISVVACHLEDGSCKHTSYYKNVHCIEMSIHYDKLTRHCITQQNCYIIMWLIELTLKLKLDSLGGLI